LWLTQEEHGMVRIGIILGSTRPGRRGEAVAQWALDVASQRGDAQFELVDLADYPLPHLDEATLSIYGQYEQPHTKAWAEKIASFDGYIFVTPEYNHSTSGVLKNAIDYLYGEWNNKAAGFIGYGAGGASRAVEHLRLIAGEVQMADVRNQVLVSLYTDYDSFTVFKPGVLLTKSLHAMLDQLVAWSSALAPLRAESSAALQTA
jgi:NAD(P)H-dependent FMN reductase